MVARRPRTRRSRAHLGPQAPRTRGQVRRRRLLDGNLADLTLGIDNDGFSLSDSGGHLSAAAATAVSDAADALAQRQVRIPPHATTPATGGRTPDAVWTLRHDDGASCLGDLPQTATIDVGGMVVSGTSTGDLRTRPLETVTRLRMAVGSVGPGTVADGVLHIDRQGVWGALCTVQDGRVQHPAFLWTVEG